MKDACVHLMTVRALNAVATSWDLTLPAPSLLVLFVVDDIVPTFSQIHNLKHFNPFLPLTLKRCLLTDTGKTCSFSMKIIQL